MMNGKIFAAAAIIAASGFAARAENLIPSEPSRGPNVWCTFASQKLKGKDAEKMREAMQREPSFPGDWGGPADFMRSCLTEELIFGKDGKGGCADFWPEIRGDLFLLFDDGWDVPFNTPHDNKHLGAFGSFELDQKKFPSCTGTPAERLKKLNEMCKARGWRGAGVWIAAQATGETYRNRLSLEKLREYWKERLMWSKAAGILYWKIDWGIHAHDVEFRKMLSELGREYYPELYIENAWPIIPFNDFELTESGGVGSGEYAKIKPEYLRKADEILKISNVFRTYDVREPIASTTTLDRAAHELAVGRRIGSNAILTTVLDTYQIAVGLSCADDLIQDDLNKNASRRYAAIRTVMWQRIAPALPVDALEVFISKERFEDTYRFKPEKTWWNPCGSGEIVRQSAPAIVSRGIENPKVSPKGKFAPYVMATLSPNGAFALSCANRLRDECEKKVFLPSADIDVDLDCLNRKICLFNVSGSVSFKLPAGIDKVSALAQDLAKTEAVDVSKLLKVESGKLTVPADEVAKFLKCEGNMPGFVLLIKAAK